MFADFTESQLRDMYFYYAKYRDDYCTINNTFRSKIGIGEFYEVYV